MTQRHPYSGGACTFCGDPDPSAPQHVHESGLVDDGGNHALLVGQLVGLLSKESSNIMSFEDLDVTVDSQGNYMDTIVLTLKSGKYDITVRPQQ